MKITKDSIMFQNGTYKLNNKGIVISDGDPVQALETISLEVQAAHEHLNKDFDLFPSAYLYIDGSKNGVSIQVVNESEDNDLVTIYIGEKIVEVGYLSEITKGLVDDVELHEEALLQNFHDTAEEPYMRNRIEDGIKRLMDEPVTKRPFFTVISGESVKLPNSSISKISIGTELIFQVLFASIECSVAVCSIILT